jgi:glycosyltransferase involved in cell wall biosynthesis
MKRKILLFIPMYNCGRQIGRVIAKIGPEAREHITEVLVADNGSSDDSLERAGEALRGLAGVRTTLVRNLGNYSLGGSLKVAFNYCLDNDYEHCIVLHGDDQADLADILPLLRDESFYKHDCAFGSRFDPRSRLSGYSRTRILGNKALNLLASLSGRRRISDLGSGLNMYKAAFLKDRFYSGFPDTLTFDVYMLLRCLWTGADFIFFPISWSESDQKSNAKAFRQGASIVALLFKYLIFPRGIFAARPARKYAFTVIYSNNP